MSKIISFNSKQDEKVNAKKQIELKSSRCERLHKVLIGRSVESIECITEEIYILHFDNGSTLNLTIASFTGIDEILSSQD